MKQWRSEIETASLINATSICFALSILVRIDCTSVKQKFYTEINLQFSNAIYKIVYFI